MSCVILYVRLAPGQSLSPSAEASARRVGELRRMSYRARRPDGSTLAGARGLHAFSDQPEHLALVGELSGLQLGIHQLAIERQLEAAAARGDELQPLNLLLISFQNAARQTDGLRLVISEGAVAKLNFHGVPPTKKRCGLTACPHGRLAGCSSGRANDMPAKRIPTWTQSAPGFLGHRLLLSRRLARTRGFRLLFR
jgi:hypothetical protein